MSGDRIYVIDVIASGEGGMLDALNRWVLLGLIVYQADASGGYYRPRQDSDPPPPPELVER